MPKKTLEVFSILTVTNGKVLVEKNLTAESCKARLASIEKEDAADAYVFAGLPVEWGTEIALFVDAAPTQQPTEKPKRKYTRKPKETPPVSPRSVREATGGNGKGEEPRT